MLAHELGASSSRRTGAAVAAHARVPTAFLPGVCLPSEPPGRRAWRLAGSPLNWLLVILALAHPARAGAGALTRAATQLDATALVEGSRLRRTL